MERTSEHIAEVTRQRKAVSVLARGSEKRTVIIWGLVHAGAFHHAVLNFRGYRPVTHSRSDLEWEFENDRVVEFWGVPHSCLALHLPFAPVMLLEADSLRLVWGCCRLVGAQDLRYSGTRGRVDCSVGDGQGRNGRSNLSCLLVWLPERSLMVGTTCGFAERSSGAD